MANITTNFNSQAWLFTQQTIKSIKCTFLNVCCISTFLLGFNRHIVLINTVYTEELL